MSRDARPVLDELDLDVGEAVDVLDREILAVVHELPFADVVGGYSRQNPAAASPEKVARRAGRGP